MTTQTPAQQPETSREDGSFLRWWKQSSRLRFFLVFSILVLTAWEWLCSVTGVRPYIFPAPSQVFKELINDPQWLAAHTAYSVSATLIAFAISVVLGLILSVGIVYSRLLDRTLFTTLVATNAIPKVAIAPLFVLWIGTDIESKVLIAVLVSIFPMVVDSVVGLRSVDPGMLDLARTYRGTALQMFWKIRFPNALPSIFAGMKVAISLSLVGTIVGEFVGSNWGLGFVILQSQGQYNTPRVFAAILVLSILGTLMFQIVDMIERRAMPWHVSHRNRHDED
ncbi:ABC transporter permease [Ferrovibrio sp.]|uniref:ABC transporter permease n=1 Tax=Ferrovibrio sp. TaxID=1917215 RepID=UPI0025B8962D|nr:ABC transporter permease [Ferrovibrio sp.]MBX3453668.1 ABC transporter permease [Ferrovibrio sp.]